MKIAWYLLMLLTNLAIIANAARHWHDIPSVHPTNCGTHDTAVGNGTVAMEFLNESY